MKRLLIFIIPFLILGCSKKLEINDKITEIKYNNYVIDSGDFNKIKNMIGTNFNKKYGGKLSDKLMIKTTKNIYYFYLDNEMIKYNGMVQYNNKLNNFLNDLIKKYTNKDFYFIDYKKNYEEGGNNILLDKTSNYIILNFKEDVYDFRINEIEKSNDKFDDVNLLYSQDVVSENIVIRKTIDYENPDIKISFKNKYGYTFSIIPFYINDNLKFNVKIA